MRMSKERIPFEIVNVDNGGETPLEVKIYKWILQSEENNLQNILGRGQEFEVKSKKENDDEEDDRDSIQLKVTMEAMADYNQKRVEYYLKNLTWDEYDVLSPEARATIQTKIEEISNKKK